MRLVLFAPIIVGFLLNAGTEAGLSPKQDTVRALACEASVPPELALAVIDHESGFDNSMRGRRGELGASQILPSTARALGFDLAQLANDYSYNIRAGVSILKRLLKGAGGDRIDALCRYRSGYPLDRLAGRMKGSVRTYVAKVERLIRTKYSGVTCQ